MNTAQHSTDDPTIINNVSNSAEDAQKALDDLLGVIRATPLSTQIGGRQLSAFCRHVIKSSVGFILKLK